MLRQLEESRQVKALRKAAPGGVSSAAPADADAPVNPRRRRTVFRHRSDSVTRVPAGRRRSRRRGTPASACERSVPAWAILVVPARGVRRCPEIGVRRCRCSHRGLRHLQRLAGNAILAGRARDVGQQSALGSWRRSRTAFKVAPSLFPGLEHRPRLRRSRRRGPGSGPSRYQNCRKQRQPASRARAHIVERRHPAPQPMRWHLPGGTRLRPCRACCCASPRRAVPCLLAAFNRKVRREYQF